MKIRANRKALAEALTWTAQAVPKRPQVPVLAGMKLAASEDVLTLSGFDYETSHTCRVDVETADDGACIVNGHFLREVVGALKGAKVELVLDDTRLTVTSGRSTYRLAVLNADDFPNLPAFPAAVGTVAADDLVRIVGTVEHAAGRDAMLPALTGIHLVGGNDLTGSTTDRFRAAQCSEPWTWASDLEALVPAKIVTAAIKGLVGLVTIAHSGGLLALADERRTVTTRCLDNAFPKMSQLLRMEPRITVDVDAEALAEAARRASMTTEDHHIVTLAITEGEIEVTAGDEAGDGAEYVDCEASGEIEALFNAAFLADALLAAGTEHVRIGFTEASKPITVTPLDDDRAAAVALTVMPRRQK